MAKQFTNNFDDLKKDMDANSKFSDYDVELAKKNPDAGPSLYNQKLAYGKATTDDERKKANDEANRIRQQYGGYTGGEDGTSYTLTQTYAPPASEYVNKNQEKIDEWTDKLTNREPYKGQYQGKIDDLLNEIQNREEFTYNPASDPTYQAYSEKYRNEGNRAVQNVLGSAAAMNGGQLSSYGLTAAQQAQNAYAAEMSNVLPQLQQMAYEMYQDEGNAMYQNLSALMNQDDRAYGRYLDEGNALYQNLSALMNQDDREYGRYLDELSIDQSILSTLMEQNNVDYNRHQNDYTNELNQWQLNYGVDRDVLNDQRYENELALELERYENELAREQERYENELALEQARYNQSLAWDRENRSYNRALDKAKTLASVGDYSGFRGLGYSEDEISRLSNGAAGNGTVYESALRDARAMSEGGSSQKEIESFLDSFNENELTDVGLEKIIKELKLGEV